jgi:hypothetical protein
VFEVLCSKQRIQFGMREFAEAMQHALLRAAPAAYDCMRIMLRA